MDKQRMLTTPVTDDFYRRFRLEAAYRNKTIAGYARMLLERGLKEAEKQHKEEVSKTTEFEVQPVEETHIPSFGKPYVPKRGTEVKVKRLA